MLSKNRKESMQMIGKRTLKGRKIIINIILDWHLGAGILEDSI